MELNELISFLKNFLSKQKGVTEAYLFGSLSKGTEHKFSDVDIAINCEDCNIYNRICYEIENTCPTIRKFDFHNIYYPCFCFDLEEVYNGIKLV